MGEQDGGHACRSSCCMCAGTVGGGLSRRSFLGTVGGAAALTGLTWSLLKAAEPGPAPGPPRTPLVVKPIFTYSVYTRRNQTSWRNWGGIQTQQDADAETTRIQGEMKQLAAAADFPMKFLPLAAVKHPNDLAGVKDAATADAVLVYAAAGWGNGMLDAIAKLGKPVIFFLRHKSGPLYLWYEILSPRYLRRHSDRLAVSGIDYQDVVVDSQDEVLWRLRSLCGLNNTVGSRILAIGGPSGWACPQAPKLAQDRWKLDIQTVTYQQLGRLIQEARADKTAMALAKQRAADYLKPDDVKLECDPSFVEGAFLLDQIFRSLMHKAGARAITINHCMGTIMPISKTTGCLTLTTLNDDGYLAFCESDFVAIPSGLLLANITGRPSFLHNPTWPHDNTITLAHCTAPRKMNGKTLEPVRILTHFESDYGAAPKVEHTKGQRITLVNCDFEAKQWLGFSAEIVDAPFFPICRSQVDVQFKADTMELTEKMRGFHWMMAYGDYLRETGYALKRTPIGWDCLG